MPGRSTDATSARCPQCGSVERADARFCGTCGHTATTRSMVPAAPEHQFAPSEQQVNRILYASRGVRCSSFLLDVAAMISPALPLAIVAAILGRPEIIYTVIPVAFVAVWIWSQIRQGLTGNTFGKSMMGLRVVRAVDHHPPGFGPSVARSLICVATCGLAALPVLLHATPRLGLHDRCSGLTVIDVADGANPLGPRQPAALRRTPDRRLNQVRSPIAHSAAGRG